MLNNIIDFWPDTVVLEENLFDISFDRIEKTKVMMTILDGRVMKGSTEWI